jgi:hypothetical protein
VVDGATYRYTIRSRPTYSQGNAWSVLTFAVVLEMGGYTTLLVKTNGHRPDNWLNQPHTVVTPALVKASIAQALADGWQPEAQGSAYVLEVRLVM